MAKQPAYCLIFLKLSLRLELQTLAGYSYHLDQHAYVKNFFCHGINEDQAKKLPAA
jgi:hypothetical protein